VDTKERILFIVVIDLNTYENEIILAYNSEQFHLLTTCDINYSVTKVKWVRS